MPASMRCKRLPAGLSWHSRGWPVRWAHALLRWAAVALTLVLAAPPTSAHKSSDAYLFADVQPGRTLLRWDIALRDLEAQLPLDADGNRALTWGEIRAAWPLIDALALQSLIVEGCQFEVTGHALEQRNDGAYAVLQLSAPCQITPQTPLHYRLFAEVDPTHRGLLRYSQEGSAPVLRMLVPEAASAASAAAAASVPGQNSAAAHAAAADGHAPSFIGEGVHHILTGYDHLLFLLCLLLPSVLWRQGGPAPRWQAVAGWRDALWPVAKTVTLFTLAHSVTLALAALGWVQLSPSFVEPAIAATIMLAAFDNLRPRLLRWRGWVTFGFGLIHGFGFAGVLGELQLPPAQFGWALLQFNLGLELGQLSLVLALVPLLFVLRRRAAYVPVVLGAGSGLALLLAAVWLVERSTDWRLLPA